MDATGMVKMASNWKLVGEQVITSVEARNLPLSIPAKSKKTSDIVVTAGGYGKVRFLEHVQVGALQCFIISSVCNENFSCRLT